MLLAKQILAIIIKAKETRKDSVMGSVDVAGKMGQTMKENG